MIQYRIGPSKNFLGGLIQPIVDGLKFFFKKNKNLNKNLFLFFLGPLISFFVSFLIWSFFFYRRIKIKIIFFLIFIGVNSYSFIITGWRRFSKFSYLGGIRASSQTISYEISLTLNLLIRIFFFNNLKINFFKEFFFFLIILNFIIWLIIILAETNRAPFDFREGERELISGFNTEYGSIGFVFFILSEYGLIIFFSYFISIILNINIFLFILIFFLIIRSSFPRFRYDFLINLIWFKILPFVCLMILFLIRF